MQAYFKPVTPELARCPGRLAPPGGRLAPPRPASPRPAPPRPAQPGLGPAPPRWADVSRRSAGPASSLPAARHPPRQHVAGTALAAALRRPRAPGLRPATSGPPSCHVSRPRRPDPGRHRPEPKRARPTVAANHGWRHGRSSRPG